MSNEAWLLSCPFFSKCPASAVSKTFACSICSHSKARLNNQIKSAAFTLAVIHLLLPHRIRLLSTFAHEDRVGYSLGKSQLHCLSGH